MRKPTAILPFILAACTSPSSPNARFGWWSRLGAREFTYSAISDSGFFRDARPCLRAPVGFPPPADLDQLQHQEEENEEAGAEPQPFTVYGIAVGPPPPVAADATLHPPLGSARASLPSVLLGLLRRHRGQWSPRARSKATLPLKPSSAGAIPSATHTNRRESPISSVRLSSRCSLPVVLCRLKTPIGSS
jgi:hypothetical protein